MKTFQEDIEFFNTFYYKLPIEQMGCILNLLSPEAKQAFVDLTLKERNMSDLEIENDGKDFEETEFGTITY